MLRTALLLLVFSVVSCNASRNTYRAPGNNQQEAPPEPTPTPTSSPTPTPTPPSGPTPDQQNGGGGSGAPLETGISSSFVLFQDAFNLKLNNRDGGAVQKRGVSNVYSVGAYVDPNDGGKIKFFVNDRDNHRILIFNSVPTSMNADPDVVVGQMDFESGTANAGLGSISAFGFNDPVNVNVCTDGRMLVSDRANHRVLVYNRIPTANGAAADYVLGQPDFVTGTSGTTASKFNAPYGAYCHGGKLFVVERGNRRITVFNSIPIASGASADFAIGQPDLTTVSTGCAADKINAYELLFHDGKMYVADGANHRVLVFNTVPTGFGAGADVVLGQGTMTECTANRGTGVAAANSLAFPNSLAAKGNKLAVADHDNSRILFFNLPLTGGNSASEVHGQPDMVTRTQYNPPSESSVLLPKGLIFESNGFLWVGDGGNKRLKVVPTPY